MEEVMLEVMEEIVSGEGDDGKNGRGGGGKQRW